MNSLPTPTGVRWPNPKAREVYLNSELVQKYEGTISWITPQWFLKRSVLPVCHYEFDPTKPEQYGTFAWMF